MRGLLMLVVLCICVAIVPELGAQRRVNPVKSASAGIEGKNENKNPADSIDYSKLIRSKDVNGNVILVDTVTGKEVPDTTGVAASGSKVPKMKQPLLYAATIGVNIWDPVMRLFGQRYGLVEFSAELNLHNRYIPVVEVGLGHADITPDDGNFTYKVPITPYFRVGCNYNFLYNGNPDYMVYAGLRYGWSHFSYAVNNVALDDSYWNDTPMFDFPQQTSSVSYLQVLFGIRVKLFGPISAGWSFKYQNILHETKAVYGDPLYIPGYGSRKASVSGSFSITYTLPFKKKVVEVPEELSTLPESTSGATPTDAAGADSEKHDAAMPAATPSGENTENKENQH